MESLGSILKRIGSPKPQKSADGNPLPPSVEQSVAPEVCSRCHDSGWISHRVPVEHPDFGEAFRCQCKSQIDSEERGALLFKYAGLPKSNPPKTFDNLHDVSGLEDAKLVAKTYAENHLQTPILVFRGTYGCGKSHLLEAIGRRLVERGIVCRYASGPSLLDELRATYDPNTPEKFQQVFDRYDRAAVLLLDDPGSESPSLWTIEKMYLLVNNRIIRGGGLVVATNLTFQQARDQLGPRTASRLWDTDSGYTQTVVISAPDYRRRDPRDNQSKEIKHV